MPYEFKEVAFDLLEPSMENPRYERAYSAQETILKMIDEQKEKLYELAKHIVNYGLNPSTFPIVIPSSINNKRYKVLEGNRRIIALKLLIDPQLIPSKYYSLKKKFQRISGEYNNKPISDIYCIIFDNEEEPQEWIRTKHAGEKKGIGTVTWNAQQKARFDSNNEGKNSLSLQVIDYLKNDTNVQNDVKEKLKKIPISNLDRLLSDPDVRERIGVNIESGKLKYSYDPKILITTLSKIVNDLTNANFKVKQIYSKDDRFDYIDTFSQSELPNKNTPQVGSWELSSPPIKIVKTLNKINIQATEKRKTIIPYNCNIKIKDKRCHQIYKELKKIPLDEYANAASILLRVFMELSIDCFIEYFNIPNITNKDFLNKKVQYVKDYIKKNSIMDSDQLKPINVMLSDKNSLFAVDTFHAYVHNKYLHPLPNNLKFSWDNIEIFIIKIWESIT